MANQTGSSALQRMPFRGRGFVIRPRTLVSVFAFAVILSVWQAVSMLGFISPLFLPPPSSIVTMLWRMIVDGSLWEHVSVSLMRIGVGWLLGSLLGILVGLSLGLWSIARAVGIPVVSALFPIPKIALLPLFILWFGTGEASKVVTIGLGVFFPTAIAMYSGVDQVPRNLIRMAQSFGVSNARIVWKVVLPSALPSLLAGFRISSSIALLLVVSAEMIGAERGIGAFALQAGSMMRTDQLIAAVCVLSVLGLLVARLIGAAERRLLQWR